MRIWKFLLIILLTGLTQIGAATMNVAVEDLKGSGVSASDVSIVSDRLRAELLGTGRVRVMERSEMDQILREQSFQQSGACDASQCFVEIGRLLAVDRIVVGTVGKIGELFTISVRILNVETGELVYSVNTDFKGRIENFLQQVVPDVAQKIGLALQGGVFAGKADLYVTTNIDSASIEVDGEPHGIAPVSVEGLGIGDHMVTARKGNLFGSLAVNLVSDDLKKVSIELETGIGSIKVSSQPQGANVVLDGVRNVGQTPLKADSILLGEHSLELSMPGYLPLKLNVVVNFGRVETAKAELIPCGIVYLQASWNIKFKLIGPTGLQLSIPTNGTGTRVPVGEWLVSPDDSLYDAQSFTLNVTPGANLVRRISLQPKFGSLHVVSFPQATLWNGTTNLGRTPFFGRQFNSGTLDLRLESPGFNDSLFQVTVKKGSKTDMIIVLAPRYSSLQVLSSPPATLWNGFTNLGVTPYFNNEMAPGKLDLRLSGPGLVDSLFTLDLVRGQSVTFDANMRHTDAWKDSVSGKKQATLRRTLRWSSLGFALLAGGLATGYHYTAQKHADNAQRELVAYDAAQTQNNLFPTMKAAYHEQLTQANSQRHIAYVWDGVAAICASGFVLTFVF